MEKIFVARKGFGKKLIFLYFFLDIEKLQFHYLNHIVLTLNLLCIYYLRSLGTNSSMFVNCLGFCDVQHVQVWFWAKMWCSEVFEVQSCCYVTRLVLELTVWCLRTVRFFVMFDMFEVWSCCYVIRLPSLGAYSLMFMNCSVFCNVQHVRSSVLGQNVMFGSVRSLVLLLCDQTSLGTNSLMFANCSVFCDVRHVRSSILGQNVMFKKFDVRSVRSSVFWCSFQD